MCGAFTSYYAAGSPLCGQSTQIEAEKSIKRRKSLYDKDIGVFEPC